MKTINQAAEAVKKEIEEMLGLDPGSVWGVGLDTAGKKTGGEFATRVEVCFNQQRDGTPAGCFFLERELLKNTNGVIDNNWSWY